MMFKQGLVLFVLGSAVWGISQRSLSAEELTQQEQQELAAALDAWVQKFNAHDAAGLMEEYAEDADVMYLDGQKAVGREAIENAFEGYFKAYPKVKTKSVDVEYRKLAPGVVVEEGFWEETGHDDPKAPTRGRYLSVLVERNGKWVTLQERNWILTEDSSAE